jgi:hypothetical protein
MIRRIAVTGGITTVTMAFGLADAVPNGRSITGSFASWHWP